MKRFIFIILFFFLSCQNTTPPSFKINMVNDPSSLDPRKARDINTISLMKMLYEGLTRISKNGEAELALAKDLKISKDFKKYTFSLKKTFWSNGKEITSKDFLYSFKKSLSSSFPSVMRYQMFVIKNAKKAFLGKVPFSEVGVKAPDPLTLIIELENPISYFLELLSMPIFFPICENLDEKEKTWSEKENLYVGNGPFKIKNWRRNDNIFLVKNDKYWDRENVKLKNISILMISQETELKMFETGKLDWAGSPFSSLPLNSFQKISSSSFFNKQPFLGTSFLRINTKWLKEKIKDSEKEKNLRKALFHTIKRKEIVKHVLLGSQIPAFSLLPPIMNIKTKNLKKDLKEVEIDFPIKLMYINSDRNHLIAQAIQRNWEDNLKIKIKLETLEPKIFFDKLYSSSYNIAIGSWIADFNDPLNFLEIFKFKNNGTNNTFWENEEYIELLNQASKCTNAKEKKEIIEKAQNILCEEIPIIPIYYLNMCFLKRNKIKDVVISPVGHPDFKWAYIEK